MALSPLIFIISLVSLLVIILSFILSILIFLHPSIIVLIPLFIIFSLLNAYIISLKGIHFVKSLYSTVFSNFLFNFCTVYNFNIPFLLLALVDGVYKFHVLSPFLLPIILPVLPLIGITSFF